jgi:hypothetical protein
MQTILGPDGKTPIDYPDDWDDAKILAHFEKELRPRFEAQENLFGKDPLTRVARGSKQLLSTIENARDKLLLGGRSNYSSPEFQAEEARKLAEARAATEQYEREKLDPLRPFDPSFGQKVVGAVVESGAPTIAAIAAAPIVGAGLAATAGLAPAVAGGAAQQFEESQKAGRSTGASLASGLVSGLAELAPGASKPFKIAADEAIGFVKRVLKSAGYEASQEGLTSVAQTLTEKIASNPNMTLEEGIENILVGTAAGGAVGGAGGAAAGTVQIGQEKVRDIAERFKREREALPKTADELAAATVPPTAKPVPAPAARPDIAPIIPIVQAEQTRLGQEAFDRTNKPEVDPEKEAARLARRSQIGQQAPGVPNTLVTNVAEAVASKDAAVLSKMLESPVTSDLVRATLRATSGVELPTDLAAARDQLTNWASGTATGGATPSIAPVSPVPRVEPSAPTAPLAERVQEPEIVELTDDFHPPSTTGLPSTGALPTPIPSAGGLLPGTVPEKAGVPLSGTSPSASGVVPLPLDLARSKPKYRNTNLTFDNGLDAAAYVIRNRDPSALSKADEKFFAFLKAELGLTKKQAIEYGQKVYEHVKTSNPNAGTGRGLYVVPDQRAARPKGKFPKGRRAIAQKSEYDLNDPTRPRFHSRNTTSDELVDWAIANAPEPWLRAIGQKIRPHVLGLEVLQEVGSAIPHGVSSELVTAHALTVRDGERITIVKNPATQFDPTVAIHELIHAALKNRLRTISNRALFLELRAFSDKLTERLEAAAIGDENLRAAVNQMRENPEEVLTFMLSSPRIREYLRGLDGNLNPLPRSRTETVSTPAVLTGWDKFVDLVRKLLGLEPKYRAPLEKTLTRELDTTSNAGPLSTIERLLDRALAAAPYDTERDYPAPLLAQAEEHERFIDDLYGRGVHWSVVGQFLRLKPAFRDKMISVAQAAGIDDFAMQMPGPESDPIDLNQLDGILRGIQDGLEPFADGTPLSNGLAPQALREIERTNTRAGRPEYTPGDVKFRWFNKLGSTIFQIAQSNKWIKPLYDAETNEGYINKVIDMAALANEWKSRAGVTLEAWNKLKGKDKENLHGLLFKERELGRFLNPGEIARDFPISPDAQATYTAIRKDFSDFISGIEQAAVERAQRTIAKAHELLAELDRIRASFAPLHGTPYFPLKRFGKWAILVKAPEDMVYRGQRVAKDQNISVETFDTKFARDRAFKTVQAQYPTFQVETDTFSDTIRTIGYMPPAVIETLRTSLELTPEQDTELTAWITAHSPAMSFAGHLVRAKYKPGYSRDAERAFQEYFRMGSNHLARMKYRDVLSERVKGIEALAKSVQGPSRDRMRGLIEYVGKHYEYLFNPKGDMAGIRSAVSVMYLGFSPKSALVNLFQVPSLTYSALAAEAGDVKALGLITKAGKDVRKGYRPGRDYDAATQAALGRWLNSQSLTEAEGRLIEKATGLSLADATALNRAATDGTIKAGIAAEAASIADVPIREGRRSTLDTAARLAQKTANVGMKMFTLAEQFNRRTTFLAALRHYRGAGLDEGASYLKAREFVFTTQFIGERWARPNISRGWKGIFTVFTAFPLGTLHFALQNKGAARWFAIQALTGGIMGSLFAENIADLVDFVMKLVGDDDEPWNTRYEIAKALKGGIPDWIPEWLDNPDLFMYGLSADVPLLGDLSGSLSMGKIFPGTRLLGAQPSQAAGLPESVLEIGGASTSLFLRMWKYGSNDSLDTWSRFEGAMPVTAIRNISKAVRHYVEGGERRNPSAFSPREPGDLLASVKTASGFIDPAANARYRENYYSREYENYFVDRRRRLFDEFENARRYGDPDDVLNLELARQRFNASVPYPQLKVSKDALRKSWKSRERSREKLEGGHSRRKMFDKLDTLVEDRAY